MRLPAPAATARPPTPDAVRRGAALAMLGLGLVLAAPARAQLVTTLVNRDGVSLPCVTVGPLAPVAQEFCVRRTLKQGWLLKSELGRSGLTFGPDAVVSAVAAGSPGEAAGVRIGDRLVSVDGEPVRPPGAETARRMTFGARGEPVRLTLSRAGQLLERSFKRAAAPEPADAPHSPNLLLGVHPLMNWRGDFVPCMGAGVLGPAAVALCASKMQREGFVRTSTLGDTGLTFDPARTDAARVTAVAPGSPAAEADVRPGDLVTAVGGAPLAPDTAHAAEVRLFGKVGERRRLVLDRDGRAATADLVLAAGR